MTRKSSSVSLHGESKASLDMDSEIDTTLARYQKEEDWQGLVRFISSHATNAIHLGQWRVVESWLNVLPRQAIKQNPWALYWLGMCFLSEDPRKSRDSFTEAIKLFDKRNDLEGLILSSSGIIDAVTAYGDMKSLDRLLGDKNRWKTIERADISGDAECRLVTSVFNALLYHKPDSPDLPQWVERARLLLSDEATILAKLGTARLLFRYYLWYGEPAKASMVMEGLRGEVQLYEDQPEIQIQWSVVEAQAYLFNSAYDSSLKALNRGLDLAADTDLSQWNFDLRMIEIYAYISLGKAKAAIDCFNKLTPILHYQSQLSIAQYHSLASLLAIQRDRFAIAIEHGLFALNLLKELCIPFFQALVETGLAHLYFECNEGKRASKHLAQAQLIAQQINSRQLNCLGNLLQSNFDIRSGKRSHAEQMLNKVFSQSKRFGYENLCIWHPKLLAESCAEALEQNIETRYVQGLVRRYELTLDPPPLDIEQWPWPTKIYSLGRFALLKNGKPVRFSRKAQHKPLELLKVLIAYGSREVSEERITTVLWPDAEGDAAHQVFDTTLHRLRKLLGNPYALVLQDGRLSLDDHFCWVDAWALERLLGKVDNVLQSKFLMADKNELSKLSAKALALYHGHFLGHETIQSWSISLRERVRSKFLRHLMDIAFFWEQHNKWHSAVQCYQKGLEVDDLAEQFYQKLMVCYQHLGRHSEALAVYQRCRTTLSVVLGINPSPETEGIRKSLMKSQKRQDINY